MISHPKKLGSTMWLFIMLAFCLLVRGLPSMAQFIRIQVQVPSKAAFYEMTMPQFGNLYKDDGWIIIPPGDPRIGSFNITNFQNVTVMVGIASPGALVLDDYNQLPLILEAAWLNDGTNRPNHAIPFEAIAQSRKLTLPSATGKSARFEGDYATFSLRNQATLSKTSTIQVPYTAWVYLYGSLYVGDVKPGIYTGEVFVTTEYE